MKFEAKNNLVESSLFCENLELIWKSTNAMVLKFVLKIHFGVKQKLARKFNAFIFQHFMLNHSLHFVQKFTLLIHHNILFSF